MRNYLDLFLETLLSFLTAPNSDLDLDTEVHGPSLVYLHG